jgi:hypothetical protein
MTIRDLREQHAPVLEQIYSTFLRWIESKHRKKYFLYLHYMPSVLQLHLEEEEEEEEEDLFVFNDTIEAHAASSSSIFMPAPTNSTSTPVARTSSRRCFEICGKTPSITKQHSFSAAGARP